MNGLSRIVSVFRRRPAALRVSVIACSLLLVGCYVGYRASSGPTAAKQPEPGAEPETQVYFGGSKSGAIFAPEEDQQAERPIMPSSKRAEIFVPRDIEDEHRKDPPPPPPKRPQQSGKP